MACIVVPKILIPNKSVDLFKWSVVACDQFTSQRDYWEDVSQIVGKAPSALELILPEAYLEDENVQERIARIRFAMERVLSDGTMVELPEGFVLTERTFSNGKTRRGLVVAIDLEDYAYEEDAVSLIRPTEKTVVERIPPRLEVRRNAPIELPHIMLLADDPERRIIEPLFTMKESMTMLYDTNLMQNGGHIRGWFVPKGELTEQVIISASSLLNKDSFNRKYKLDQDLPMLNFAVGDGNHSLATAKAYWNQVKAEIMPDAWETHPARYCLCELVNLYDESLVIAPIHRVLLNVCEQELLECAVRFYAERGCECKILSQHEREYSDAHFIAFCTENRTGSIAVRNPKWKLEAGTLQAFLDDYLFHHPQSKIDYIHGDDVLLELGRAHGNMGFVLQGVKKEDIFRNVIMDGVLPRKTFSIGEANEKRYYIEAKRI